jgi:hypothetical protein
VSVDNDCYNGVYEKRCLKLNASWRAGLLKVCESFANGRAIICGQSETISTDGRPFLKVGTKALVNMLKMFSSCSCKMHLDTF